MTVDQRQAEAASADDNEGFELRDPSEENTIASEDLSAGQRKEQRAELETQSHAHGITTVNFIYFLASTREGKDRSPAPPDSLPQFAFIRDQGYAMLAEQVISYLSLHRLVLWLRCCKRPVHANLDDSDHMG